jgi:limonene-1,2-epoxide hydrolase
MSLTLPEGISIAASGLALVAVLFRGGLRVGTLTQQVDVINRTADKLSATVERLDRHVTRIEARCPLCMEDEPSGPSARNA